MTIEVKRSLGDILSVVVSNEEVNYGDIVAFDCDGKVHTAPFEHGAHFCGVAAGSVHAHLDKMCVNVFRGGRFYYPLTNWDDWYDSFRVPEKLTGFNAYSYEPRSVSVEPDKHRETLIVGVFEDVYLENNIWVAGVRIDLAVLQSRGRLNLFYGAGVDD